MLRAKHSQNGAMRERERERERETEREILESGMGEEGFGEGEHLSFKLIKGRAKSTSQQVKGHRPRDC